MAKAPTVYDVAERAGVSIATVSMTFRRPHKVKEETRKLVEAAAAELNYVPSASARGLAHGHTGALGLYAYDVFLPEPDEGLGTTVGAGTRSRATVPVVREDRDDYRRFPLYVHEVQRGVELECWQRGYALLIGGGSQADGATRVTDIVGRVDGLALFPDHSLPADVLERIARAKPVVAVSQRPQDDGLSTVSVDNRGGMRAMTEHLLVEHRMRDLLFVGYMNTFDAQERFAGFKSALRAAGLRVPSKPAELVGDHQVETVVADVLARDALPEAFVCVSDEIALDLMKTLEEQGVRVPEQVAVTGFDGVVAGRIVRPALTTVRQPMQAMGRAVVDILLERIADPAGAPIARRLPVQVVVRESCGCSRV
ncbi:LacI family DNA-binding transcriptional regulator [Streptomyces sp. NY05-11A]|uniref:LacI family DNA-binding transcriptional regulator n=1 Tax=Streptomyces soliscabiei TaxID=588897 RepID=UPI0029AEA529|nr:LacI family DNA-binding transcriptional regulator [Streptomyces sp. NY05-11A]MDX2680362.1 LacI family DNA-binding transcriptional regulator [Streptomyces sp. NY05-11A]